MKKQFNAKAVEAISVVAILSAATVGVTGCGDSTSMESSGKYGYGSPEEVITVYFTAFKNEDSDLLRTCFYDDASDIEDQLGSIMDFAGNIAFNYYDMRTDDVEIELVREEEVKKSIFSRNNPEYDKIAEYTAVLPLTLTTKDASYDMYRTYDFECALYNDKWCITYLSETDAQLLKNTDSDDN